MGDGIRRNGRRRRAAGVALHARAASSACAVCLAGPRIWGRRGEERVHDTLWPETISHPPVTPARRRGQVLRLRALPGPARGRMGPRHLPGPVRSPCSRAVPCRSSAERRSFLQPAPRYSSPSFKRKKILHAGGFHVLKADRQASSADHSENTGYVAMCHVPHRMQGPHQGFPAAAATSAHNGCPGLRRKPDHRSPAEVPYWAGVSRAPPASCQTD